MTKPRVSTVINDDDDTGSLDNLFDKLDMAESRTAKEASKIADAKEAALNVSSGLFEYMSAAEYREEATSAVAKEKEKGYLLKLYANLPTLNSPFAQGKTPDPTGVSLHETP